jgi:hypothetical protein
LTQPGLSVVGWYQKGGMVGQGSSVGPRTLPWRGYMRGKGKNDFEITFNWKQLRGIPSNEHLESFWYCFAILNLLNVRKPSNSKSSHHSPVAFHS